MAACSEKILMGICDTQIGIILRSERSSGASSWLTGMRDIRRDLREGTADCCAVARKSPPVRKGIDTAIG